MIKNVLYLLCGIWAMSLGARYSFELLVSDGWISIPKYAGFGVNLWFDFIPLAVFGFIIVVFETKTLCDKYLSAHKKADLGGDVNEKSKQSVCRE